MRAPGDQRPAVIGPRLHHIEPVAATRPVIADPEAPGLGMQRRPLDVAQPDRVDRRVPATRCAGITGGAPSAVIRTSLPSVFVPFWLWSIWLNRSPVVTKRWPVRSKTRREPKCRRLLMGGSWRQIVRPSSSAVPEAESRPRNTAVPLVPPPRGSAKLRKTRRSRREGRAEGDAEQAALTGRVDRGRPGERRSDHAVAADEPEPSRPLGHEETAIGKEGEPPRMLEAAGHRRVARSTVWARLFRETRGAAPRASAPVITPRRCNQGPPIMAPSGGERRILPPVEACITA